jgi:hypothetical protein
MTPTDDDPLDAGLDALYAEYMACCCPCRFPRFRALAKQWGMQSGILSSADRDRLVWLFDQKVPLSNKHDAMGGWEATCAVCGASISFGAVESSPGGWVEYLVVTPTAPDLGAPLERPLLRCRPWRSTGPDYGSFIPAASRAYRLVELEEWLAWMRARA